MKPKKTVLPKLSQRTKKELALAVDETLVILIKHLQHEDIELRAAAREALERHIARKGRRSDEVAKILQQA